MDRTLEAVEHVHRAERVHLEAHLVVFAADLALSHDTGPSAPTAGAVHADPESETWQARTPPDGPELPVATGRSTTSAAGWAGGAPCVPGRRPSAPAGAWVASESGSAHRIGGAAGPRRLG